VIAAITFDVAGVIAALTVLAVTAGWFGSSRSGHKAARAAEVAAVTAADAIGAPNGNGPTNQALHVVIEMLKYQDQKLTHIVETVSASGAQLDELTLIVRDHMEDPNAHSALR
jgi:hypothetical protein